MADNYSQQMQSALNPGIQLALPQTVVPVTKTQSQVQSVKYDPEKLDALKKALGIKRQAVSRGELLANALANTPEVHSYKGGFGEEIINPWEVGLSSLARGFGSVYGAALANKREIAEKEREDAIKAAQLDLEASKQAITDTVTQDNMKVNDPNAKLIEQQQQFNTIATLSDKLEDIGTRFDEDFKNIDDMQQKSTRLGRVVTNLAGIGVSTKEKEARDEFKAWKGSMRNILVNANRQAGSGSMSDADAERYEQNIGDAKNPAEARMILRSFMERMQMPIGTNKETQDQTSAWEQFMKGTK